MDIKRYPCAYLVVQPQDVTHSEPTIVVFEDETPSCHLRKLLVATGEASQRGNPIAVHPADVYHYYSLVVQSHGLKDGCLDLDVGCRSGG
jgi:hypothetical protein